MTATAATILVLLNSAASSANVITFTLEIICMTGCAVGRILRVGPGKHRVDAVAMAAAATQVACMVARVVALRVVTEAGRRPAGRDVACVTLERRIYVTQRFGCRSATVYVTLVAVARAAGVVNPGTTDECGSGVAGRAIQAGAQVRWVSLRIHADSRNTIVARGAIVHDAGMIEGGR